VKKGNLLPPCRPRTVSATGAVAPAAPVAPAPLTVCLHFELLYFLKYDHYDVLSEYLTPFWFAMLLNEYEIEFMFRKIRNNGQWFTL
jgi:hypothetical protein